MDTSLSFICHEHGAAELCYFQNAWIFCLECDAELIFNWISVKNILEEIPVEVRNKWLAIILNSQHKIHLLELKIGCSVKKSHNRLAGACLLARHKQSHRCARSSHKNVCYLMAVGGLHSSRKLEAAFSLVEEMN